MGHPIVRMSFMLRSYFFFFLSRFRVGMANNENALACTTRRELMSLADVISYQAEYGRNEK